MPTTFCTSSDLAFVLSAIGVTRAIDDNEDGLTSSSPESGFADSAISIGATEIIPYIERRYKLSEVTGNAWLRWTNAYFAAYFLMTRRGNLAPASLQKEFDRRLEILKAIGDGTGKLPEQNESFDFSPCVSNYESELRANRSKVRVVRETSTGGPLPAGRLQHTDDSSLRDYYE